MELDAGNGHTRHSTTLRRGIPSGQDSQRAGRDKPSGRVVAGSPMAPLTWGWVRKRAVERSQPRTSVSRRSAPRRSTSRRSAPRRSAAISSAPRNDQPRWSPVEPSAGEVGARAVLRGGPRPSYASAGLRQQAAHPLVQGVDVGEEQGLGVGAGELLDLGAYDVGSRVGRAPGDLDEVDEHLVELAHHRQHRGHLGEVVLLAPRRPAVGDLGDLLAGAEALEDRAPGPPVLAQGRVDAAAVVAEQVEARAPAGLVDAETGRGGEGEQHAAEAEAARAVRAQPGCRHPGIVSCVRSWGRHGLRRTSRS